MSPRDSLIHPTAVIAPDVRLGPGCEVGPFCHFEGQVTIGEGNRFATGVAIGGSPMDTKYQGEQTEVRIGSDNAFHEYSSIHRSTGLGTATVIGDGNMVMAYVHVAHNCRIGSRCVITNGVQLGGHVEVGNRATIGGLVGVHQFCRIGELAMVGACSYVNKDIPPFMLAAGNPCRVRGLNLVGLRRAGLAEPELGVLRRACHVVYRSGLNREAALRTIETELAAQARPESVRGYLEVLIDFIRSSRRGVELRTGPEQEEEQ